MQRVGASIARAAKYREFAQECARLAMETMNERHRVILKEMEAEMRLAF